MNIILSYFLITLASVAILALLLIRARQGILSFESERFQLQSELRSDLRKGWRDINLPEINDLTGKWFRIAHTIDRRSVQSRAHIPSGRFVIELVYGWLASRVFMNEQEVAFTFNNSFQNTFLEEHTQESLFAFLSNIMCHNTTLTTIQINSLQDEKVIEVTCEKSDVQNPFILDEKNRKKLFTLNGKITEKYGRITILLPYKKWPTLSIFKP